MKIITNLNSLDWLKLAQGGVQSVIRKNQYGRHFFTLYGNTFDIKDKIKDMGFKFFQGTWSKPADLITDSDKNTLKGLGVDISVLDIPVETTEQSKDRNVAQESQGSAVQPEKPKTPVEQELEKMKYGVELAMKKEEGGEKVRGLLQFIDRMIEKVASMTDDASQSEFVKSFLSFSAKFHNYSFHNQILIWVQKPDATYVNGFRKWMEMGREVTNWDNGIVVIAPMIKKVKLSPEEASSLPPEEAENSYKTHTRFSGVKVYDISDTRPIPGWEEMKGKKPFEPTQWRKDSNEAREEITSLVNAVIGWAKSQNIDYGYEKMAEEMGGFSAGGKIRINDTYQGINLFSTAVHEIAHELLHWESTEETKRSKESRLTTRQQKEIDAETTAYIVLQHYGFETVDTPNYLALWKAKGEDIKERREHINKAVKTIIKAIDSEMARTIAEENVEAKNKSKIIISRSQWEKIGKIAGWIKFN